MIYFVHPNLFIKNIQKYSLNMQKNLIDLAINPVSNYQIIGLKKLLLFSNIQKQNNLKYEDLINILIIKWKNMDGKKKGFYAEYLAKLLYEYENFIKKLI